MKKNLNLLEAKSIIKRKKFKNINWTYSELKMLILICTKHKGITEIKLVMLYKMKELNLKFWSQRYTRLCNY